MSHFVTRTIATLLLLVPGIGLYADEGTPLRTLKLSAENAKLRDFVLPNPSEASYRKIPWRTSVLQGIVVSQVHRKMDNQDYAWFRESEARAFLPEQPIKGAKRKVKRDLVERLARFHFVDLVREADGEHAVRRHLLRGQFVEELIDIPHLILVQKFCA